MLWFSFKFIILTMPYWLIEEDMLNFVLVSLFFLELCERARNTDAVQLS